MIDAVIPTRHVKLMTIQNDIAPLMIIRESSKYITFSIEIQSIFIEIRIDTQNSDSKAVIENERKLSHISARGVVVTLHVRRRLNE